METVSPEAIDVTGKVRRSPNDTFDSLRYSICNLKGSDHETSDDEVVLKKQCKKRFKRFSDSDSDSNREKTQNEMLGLEENSHSLKYKLQSDDSESDTNKFKGTVHKSRLQKNKDLSDSEKSGSDNAAKKSDSSVSETDISKRKTHKSRLQRNENSSDSEEAGSDNAVKNKEQQLRMKNKKNKLINKFKTLVTSRGKDSSTGDGENKKKASDSSSESSEELVSIEKIKQKIKERMSFKPSICDPDTSDEESNQQKSVIKQKKERKITKLTSPKPQRMSAKQAMENMQKIKSESNRMLREKEVSLPYHRPKALTLKDIMSRRKQALSSDGKSLPIKMNGEQLKQYVKMLEERQKEIMVLCKSESEDEEHNENPTDIDKDTVINETNTDDTISTQNINNIKPITDTDNPIKGINLNQDCYSKNVEGNMSTDKDFDEITNEQDSETSIQLVYNDSANSVTDDKLTADEDVTNSVIENGNISAILKNTEEEIVPSKVLLENSEIADEHEYNSLKQNTEVDSQLISLHFDSENTDNTTDKNEVAENKSTGKNIEIVENNLTDGISYQDELKSGENESMESNQFEEGRGENKGMEVDSEFSDDEMNIAEIDDVIENAEIIKDIEDKVNSQFLVRDKPLNLNPKLTGGPGMVIDLDENDQAPRTSGIELLKERFTYFSKLKTSDEIEKERDQKVKPGIQLKKLKQELEEEMAEQRSLEWAKRLEDEKQQQKELKVLRGEESDEDDIDQIEVALEGKEDVREESEKSESEEEEPIEDDVEIKDRPRVKNAMLDDEAEVSDCDGDEDKANNDDAIEKNGENEEGIEQNGNEDDGIDNDDDDDEDESESDESESSESEEEQASTTKRGRILKAFEDSDEEEMPKSIDPVSTMKVAKETNESKTGSSSVIENFVDSQVVSQDEELQLAQIHKSASEDVFTSQESALLASEAKDKKYISENDEAFTQTFSILDSTKQPTVELDLTSSGKISIVCNTQTLEVSNLDEIAALCPLTDSQNDLPSQIPITQLSQSQPIGEDILALCTGQFYNNQFVSQVGDSRIPLSNLQKYDAFNKCLSQDSQESQDENAYNSEAAVPCSTDIRKEKDTATDNIEPKEIDNFIELNAVNVDGDNRKLKIVDDNLKSILDELAESQFDLPKPNKFFVGSKNTQRNCVENEIQIKRKLIIDSDDEGIENVGTEAKKRKTLKKKRPEQRALQISDDEEEMPEEEEIEENESDIEEENCDRLVEYDSEENEIEIKPQNPKKKRKMAEFFENEAELTSEDEWVGSGDEDEAGLDRMEREEGDDEIFHQGKLQRELGQIHMRDVLDQDKREVRLIQELLFEDGDLGGGGRQRKFRWNNMGGDEETGTAPDNLTETQEEFESEEQWRKQRHEREMFLRQMHNKDDPESINVSVNRSTIIKANLLSKTMSSVMDVSVPSTGKTESPTVEKKTAKDVPSPKKPFALMQHSYQSSLLSRSRGALARLAALAAPLAADDDSSVGTLGPTSRRNFVFTALTADQKEPKVTKRKAENNQDTPKLVKKMRTEEKQITPRSSLLDHFKL